MFTARIATPDIAPRRLTRALQLLPAAALFAGLVLGGPSFIEDPGTRLDAMNQYCILNDVGDWICTGSNTGNDPINGIYDLSGGI